MGKTSQLDNLARSLSSKTHELPLISARQGNERLKLGYRSPHDAIYIGVQKNFLSSPSTYFSIAGLACDTFFFDMSTETTFIVNCTTLRQLIEGEMIIHRME